MTAPDVKRLMVERNPLARFVPLSAYFESNAAGVARRRSLVQSVEFERREGAAGRSVATGHYRKNLLA